VLPRPEIEKARTSWKDLKDRGLVPPDHAELICGLQCVHDRFFPEDWPLELKKVARPFNVNTSFLDSKLRIKASCVG
jgi:hypothetical protein